MCGCGYENYQNLKEVFKKLKGETLLLEVKSDELVPNIKLNEDCLYYTTFNVTQ